ncbi:methylosome subunit pICln-like isoform X2 [Clavelina lepadiformis]|uniref:Methylosome subunit pICln n=1 Tax=Clavelina lepadiformis TaxID=159417 RepID=A0ABP0F5T4_CLALP
MYSVTRPDSSIYHKEDCCKANIDSTEMGDGTLYITEIDVVWCTNENRGFKLQYGDIAVHAISTDSQAFPEECFYVMYNRNLLNEDESNDEDEPSVSEVRFIPSDKDHLKAMFNAMSDCQCLHPDEEDDSDFSAPEDDVNYEGGAAGEGFYTGEEGIEHLTPQGLATMQRLEAMLGENGHGESGDGGFNGLHIAEDPEEGQFDDA